MELISPAPILSSPSLVEPCSWAPSHWANRTVAGERLGRPADIALVQGLQESALKVCCPPSCNAGERIALQPGPRPDMEPLSIARAPITILIAVAVRLYREGLAATLNAQEHLRIEGTVGTRMEAQTAIRRLQPDVVIVDVSIE